jgi:hypothetical protein
MQGDRSVYLACRLSRSGFSGERVFRVCCHDGSEHVGVAPTHYCHTIAGEPLGRDLPPKGARIEGLIEGILVDRGSKRITVALPDGDTIQVDPDQLRSPEGALHVSVGS